MKRSTAFFLFSVVAFFWWMIAGIGCAQIGFPTGGVKDTIPPVLVSAAPPSQSIGFTGKKIVFTFNEYIDLQDLQKNIFISPPLKNNPFVTSYLTHVNINFRDSLAPNTTYIISLGNAIRDINENNVFSNFNYDNWDMMCANQENKYYDLWALRHEYWMPFDLIEQINFKRPSFISFDDANNMFSHARRIHIDRHNRPIKVESAFGGMAIVKIKSIKTCIFTFFLNM
jgi:hypothetical protein